LADFAKDAQRFAFQTQVYCLLTRYRQQCELHQLDLFAPGGAVADYTFARDALFAKITLRPEEFGLYQRIHELLDARIPTPDLFVYLTADREVLRSRIRKVVAPGDRVIKLSVLDELASSMDEYAFSYEGGPMLVINTSEFDGVELPHQLEEFIDVINKTRAGSNHYRPIR
jgi:deoxyadenosine/deoxycytidine kinase